MKQSRGKRGKQRETAVRRRGVIVSGALEVSNFPSFDSLLTCRLLNLFLSFPVSLVFSRPVALSAERPIPAKPQHVIGGCYRCGEESNKEEKVKDRMAKEGTHSCMCSLFEILKGGVVAEKTDKSQVSVLTVSSFL